LALKTGCDTRPSRSVPKESQHASLPLARRPGKPSSRQPPSPPPPHTCVDTVRWHAHACRVATLFSPLSSSPRCHRRTYKFSPTSPTRKSLPLPALATLCARACMLVLSEHGHVPHIMPEPSCHFSLYARVYKRYPLTRCISSTLAPLVHLC
jgi:hypothetical protein